MIVLLAGHVLESTAVAIMLALLTLCFANNRAAVRYGLWFAASVKFLIPFSLLVAAGETLRWKTAPAVRLDLAWAAPVAAPDLLLPAALTDMAASSAVAPIVGPAASGPDLESVLLAVWLGGITVLLGRWISQWSRLRRVCRDATPSGIAAKIPVRFSRTLFEPGLVGIVRPVLLLPDGITAQLSPAQLALVIEHELYHWRRRDNLTAAVHMAVELIFWFHPLVWWIGARLVAERERACDESVLAAGGDPRAYADSILEVCRYYLRSPLRCASGIAGANLTRRVRRVMENAAAAPLSDVKRALLASIAAGALLLPTATGMLTPAASAAQPAARTSPAPAPQTLVRPLRKPTPAARSARTDPRAVEVAARGPAPERETVALAADPPQVMDAPREERIAAESLIASADSPAPSGAAPAASPPAAALDEIVVTAKRIREFVRTRNFVRTYTAPSAFLDQLSRWQAPICVQTVGLKPAYNAFVTARLREVAAQIGAPVAPSESCDVNLNVIFTEHPQELLDYIRSKRPDLLGPHYPSLRKALATVSHPVQAWYATGTRDSRGRWSIDSYDGFGETIEGGPPVYYALGSHLRSGLKSEFASVVVVADMAKVQHLEIGTVADTIAMQAFARTKTFDRCQGVPSVANVLADCSETVRSKALSDFDVAYLKALYASASDAPRALQESGISRAMLKILEQQLAAQKSAPAR